MRCHHGLAGRIRSHFGGGASGAPISVSVSGVHVLRCWVCGARPSQWGPIGSRGRVKGSLGRCPECGARPRALPSTGFDVLLAIGVAWLAALSLDRCSAARAPGASGDVLSRPVGAGGSGGRPGSPLAPPTARARGTAAARGGRSLLLRRAVYDAAATADQCRHMPVGWLDRRAVRSVNSHDGKGRIGLGAPPNLDVASREIMLVSIGAGSAGHRSALQFVEGLERSDRDFVEHDASDGSDDAALSLSFDWIHRCSELAERCERYGPIGGGSHRALAIEATSGAALALEAGERNAIACGQARIDCCDAVGAESGDANLTVWFGRWFGHASVSRRADQASTLPPRSAPAAPSLIEALNAGSALPGARCG